MAELQIRNPNTLTIVSKVWLDKNPDKREDFAKFYDLRADSPLDPVFKNQVAVAGVIKDPIHIIHIEGFGDVVTDGRQRTRAAVALGLTSVPVIIESDDDKNILNVEGLNLARRDNTVRENAAFFKKCLQMGKSPEDVATLAGKSVSYVRNAILLGEMPAFVHKLIDKGELSETAALGLRTFGKKAPKTSGLITIYDEEAQKSMQEAINAMSVEAKLKGGTNGRISVKQARESHPSSVETYNKGEWERLAADENTPEDYAALINAVIGKISPQQAKSLHPEHLSFIRRIEKPKKEKAPKVAKVKASKEDKVNTEVDASEVDVNSFFQ
jgi:ParB/RepB/Spo0J family partition protein